MVKITIDKKQMTVDENLTILQAAKNEGISIPTLCYLKDLNEIGACRLCVVEIAGMDRLVASCNTKVQEGMVIATNTEKVWATRKLNTELILSQHDCRCAKCSRSGNCVLQKIANDMGLLSNCVLQKLSNDLGLLEVNYPKKLRKVKWNEDFPIIRDEARCVKCMRCIQVCEKMQSVGVWEIVNTGSRTTVAVTENRKIETSNCVLCGQCITHCPVGALWARDDTEKVLSAIADPDKITIVQMAPAVQTAWGETLGLADAQASKKRLTAAMREIGFDYVFLVDSCTDLMIMETAKELLEKLKHKEKYKYPLLTSNCPGWIRFIKTQYPDMTEELSTTKSSQQIFGAIVKSYYAERLGINADKIYCVSITSCVARKYECVAEKSASNTPSVDISLTTSEIIRMMKTAKIKVRQLPEEDFDQPLSLGSGAASIADTAGGIADATLRTLYYLISGENPEPNTFTSIFDTANWKEINFNVKGTTIKTAAANGLGNVRKLLEAIRSGEVNYDFVEIMACPGGCVGGGGQPIHEGHECYKSRGQKLYDLDAHNPLRFAHENPIVKNLYHEYLEHLSSEKINDLLHTDQNHWKL